MNNWQKSAILLTCTYGILKKIRPGTPFLTPFLESSKNLTNDELYGEVFPYWTYSNMLTLVPMFFLSDLLHYRPVIVVEAVALCATWFLLVYGSGVAQMQLMQIFYGVATSAEVAYASYLYAVVDARHYKRVTSYTASATMCGKFFGYSLGQILVSTRLASYLTLNTISLYAFALCVPVTLCLPPVRKGNVANVSAAAKAAILPAKAKHKASFFAKDSNSREEILQAKLLPCVSSTTTMDEITELSNLQIAKSTAKLQASTNPMPSVHRRNSHSVKIDAEKDLTKIVVIADDLTVDSTNVFSTYRNRLANFFHAHAQLYRNPVVLSWSIWWALASCGMYQIFNYIQTLWALRQLDGQSMANGFVESLNTLIGALTSFALQFTATNWQRHAEWIFAASSLATGALLFAMICAANVFVDYFGYLCVATLYNLVMNIASHAIAVELSPSEGRGDPSANDDVAPCAEAVKGEEVDDEDAVSREHSQSRRHSFSAVFGTNSLAALLCQSLLTRLIADKSGPFALRIEAQFCAYGIYFCAVGAIFSALIVAKRCRKR